MGVAGAFAVQAMMGLTDIITGPLKSIDGAMARTERGAGTLGGRMGSLAKAMLPLVVAMGVVVAGFGSCVGATLETQAALGELASVGVSDMQALSGAAEDFSSQWAGTTKAEFIGAAYDIKSGISTLTDTGVAEFTKLAALTGKATKSTTSEMTSLFATGYGIYKGMYGNLTDLQFGEVFSAGISASVKNFKTTGSGMAQAISSLGAAATTARVPLSEQLSILGMLQATMSGSEAGTKYKAMMQAAAGAGEKLSLQFMDSNNQLLSMPEILTAMKGKYGTTLDAMEKMEIQKAFGTQEAVAVIDLLYGKLDDLTGNISGMETAMGQGTATTQAMADTMNNDLGSVLTLNGQKWHNLKETIGGVFIPVVKPLAVGIGKVMDGFSALAKSPVGKALVYVAGGVALATLGFAAFATASAGLSVAIPFVTASLAPLGAAVAAISWPVWVVIGAVGLLALAWKNNFGGMADTLSGWWGRISLMVQGVKAVFASLSGTVGTINGQLAGDIEAAGLVGLVTTVARVVFRIGQTWSGLWGGLSSTMDGLFGILAPVVTPLVDAFKPLWKIITYVGTALFGASAAADSSSWKTFGAVVGVVVGSAFQVLAWGIRIALLPLTLTIKVVGWLLSAFVGLGEGIGMAAGWIVAHASAIGSGIKWAFMNLTPLGWMIQAFSGIKGFLEGFDLSEAGARLMRTLASGIKNTIMMPFTIVKSGLSKLRNLLPFSDAKEGPLSTLTLSGARMMTTLAGGVASGAPALKTATVGALAGVAAITAVEVGEVDAGVPPLPGGGPVAVEEAVAEGKAGRGGESASTVMHLTIENLNLSGVQNSEQLIEELLAMVEALKGRKEE